MKWFEIPTSHYHVASAQYPGIGESHLSNPKEYLLHRLIDLLFGPRQFLAYFLHYDISLQ